MWVNVGHCKNRTDISSDGPSSPTLMSRAQCSKRQLSHFLHINLQLIQSIVLEYFGFCLLSHEKNKYILTQKCVLNNGKQNNGKISNSLQSY